MAEGGIRNRSDSGKENGRPLRLGRETGRPLRPGRENVTRPFRSVEEMEWRSASRVNKVRKDGKAEGRLGVLSGIRDDWTKMRQHDAGARRGRPQHTEGVCIE